VNQDFGGKLIHNISHANGSKVFEGAGGSVLGMSAMRVSEIPGSKALVWKANCTI